jgi:hypothetical protein
MKPTETSKWKPTRRSREAPSREQRLAALMRLGKLGGPKASAA